MDNINTPTLFSNVKFLVIRSKKGCHVLNFNIDALAKIGCTNSLISHSENQRHSQALQPRDLGC